MPAQKKERPQTRTWQERLAAPSILGLYGFAGATFMVAAHMAHWFGGVQTNMVLWPFAALFGGLAQFIAGMWAFAYGDPLAATVFTFVGAFYGWWGLNGLVLHGAAMNPASMALVFIACAFVVAYLWIGSFYETAVFNLVLLFLWIAYVLMGIGLATSSTPIAVIAGISAIISGVVAAYGSFAELFNAATLQEVVPLGEPKLIRERSAHEEEERLRRIHPVGNQHHEMHA
jgi:succinate-acetate transporter protein